MMNTDEWLTRAVFRAIKTATPTTTFVELAYLLTTLGVGKTTLNRKLVDLTARGLVTRSIDPKNPAKRKMVGAVHLTPLGRKTKPETVTPAPKPLTELQVGYWRYLRHYGATSIKTALAVISVPETPTQKAANELYGWVKYLKLTGYIDLRNGEAKKRLIDQVYVLEKDTGPEAPKWIEE